MLKFKLCRNCGSKNHKKHQHCTKCGSALDNVLKTSTKPLVIFLVSFLLLGSSTTYAYSKYYKKSPTISEQSSGQSSTDKPKPPYTCPSGMESPKGGSINWDGSEDCIPKATLNSGNDTTKNVPKTTTPKTTTNNTTPTPTPEPTPTPTPTPAPDTKVCDDQKATQLASVDTIYNGKVYTENTQHEANLAGVTQDYSNRGLLRSGAYIQAIDSENAAHQVRLNDINAWYNLELVKIDQSC